VKRGDEVERKLVNKGEIVRKLVIKGRCSIKISE